MATEDVAEREFPILLGWQIRQKSPPRSIPWAVIAPHARQAEANHYQTLERLAARGGLSWSEAAAVLADRKWRPMRDDEAEAAVMAAVDSYLQESPTS